MREKNIRYAIINTIIKPTFPPSAQLPPSYILHHSDSPKSEAVDWRHAQTRSGNFTVHSCPHISGKLVVCLSSQHVNTDSDFYAEHIAHRISPAPPPPPPSALRRDTSVISLARSMRIYLCSPGWERWIHLQGLEAETLCARITSARSMDSRWFIVMVAIRKPKCP
jgi:hypothetical protein